MPGGADGPAFLRFRFGNAISSIPSKPGTPGGFSHDKPTTTTRQG
jgi:hypothetical protein